MSYGYRETSSKAISITTNPWYSDIKSLRFGDAFSFQFVYTGGTGYGVIELSNDGVNFSELANSSITMSGNNNAIWSVWAETGCGACRMKFVNAVGVSGNLIYVGRN